MYEGDIVIPVHLWSRTSLIEELGDEPADFVAGDCFRWYSGLARGVVPGLGSSDVMGSGCALTFLPHFTFRQQSGGSAPVLTPTFNPGAEFNVYVLGLDKDRTERGLLGHDAGSILSNFSWLGMRPRDSDVSGTLAAVHLRLAHYSNGQSGCLYTNQVYNEVADSCEQVADAPVDLNTRDGSFSTHYLEFGMTVVPMAFDPDGIERRAMGLGYAVRWHPGGWASGIGGMSAELARAYGRLELSANTMLRWRTPPSAGTWRPVATVRAEGVWAYKRDSQYDTFRGSVEALLTFPSLYGFGVSARYVTGWDPYNIAFGRSVSNHPWGLPILSLVIDHSRAVTITRRGRATEAR